MRIHADPDPKHCLQLTHKDQNSASYTLMKQLKFLNWQNQGLVATIQGRFPHSTVYPRCWTKPRITCWQA
jgi:hypothetical protein